MFGPFVYRYTFAKNTWRWKIRQQIFPQESWPTVVRCQVYPDEHACLCLRALKLFICQMQIPCVLSNFCWQSFADEVCGEESAKVYLLALSSSNRFTEIPPQTSPCTTASNPKKSTGRRHFLVQIYSLKSSWHGASVLMQCISERLTSPIAGLGGYSKDHVFFLPEKMAQAL
jgi:hypothetical protein